MIKSLKIDLTKNLGDFYYLKNIKNFPLEYEFKDGLNIIIGTNGSGKSSIIKILHQLTFCNTDDGLPRMQKGLRLSRQLRIFEETDGFDLTNDWRFPTAILLRSEQLETAGFDFINPELCAQKMEGGILSDGENQAYSMRYFVMRYSEYIKDYDLESIIKNTDSESTIYLRKYIKTHAYDQISESMHSSILMDEPDKGLDVVLLKALYGMLKTDKKDIQIIAVVHNPFLIHLLSGFSNVIETSPNYMKLVENFIK